MSELRSALDQMAVVDTASLSVAELDAETAEILWGLERLQVLLADRVQAMSDRGGFAQLRFSSATSYLMTRGRLAPGHAKRLVSLSHAESRAPIAHKSWADGRLSTDQATVMFQVAEAVPDAYSDAEQRLIEIVEDLDVVDTRRTVEYWRQSVDGPGETEPETQMLRRGLNLSKTLGGMGRLDGWLTRAATEALSVALDSLMPPPRGDDDRTPAQRRHDALEDLCHDWLNHGDVPQVGGERPHITVLADLDALRGIAGGTHETLDGDIIDVSTLRTLACDSSVSRIVLGPKSEILDVGRKTRVWTVAQRRAIVARDRQCTAPNCHRKPQHCDIHHKTHWADGGRTNIDEGKLLCRFHHTLQHLDEDLERGRRRTQG